MGKSLGHPAISAVNAGSKFIGLANYTEMFQTPVFWKATWNTILLRILTVPVGLFPRGELCPIFPPCEGADLCHIFPIPSCHPAEDPV